MMGRVILDGNREQLFNHLDNYAYQRKSEIDRLALPSDAGLIKSYVLEASHQSDAAADVEAALSSPELRAVRLGAEDLFRVTNGMELLGWAEPFGSRFIALHSYQRTQKIDHVVRRVVGASPDLDFLWLSGEAFMLLWRNLILPAYPSSFVSVKCEQENRFESEPTQGPWYDDDQYPEDDLDSDSAAGPEHRAASSSFTDRARYLEDMLSNLQRLYPAFRAVKMLRIPATEQGGYDLWSWGKTTYRAPNFREGRARLLEIAQLYEQATAAIEEAIWLNMEPVQLPDGPSISIGGAPVTCEFSKPLTDQTFQNLVSTTFDQGKGPLRLWGVPIRLGERKVHVYGLDLHLWQRLYMELTPERFVFLLPRGTCGNTVQRLATNIQRFVDPAVELTIGAASYTEIMESVLLGREVVVA